MGANATAARLQAAGYQPVLAPFLTVRSLAASLPQATAVQAVIAASANAAALPPSHQALPLLAVGDSTAARARDAGFAAVHSADGDAAALVALAVRLLSPANGALLLATGRGQGAGLARALRAEGFAVYRRVVYAATAIRRFPQAAADAIRDGLHAALFFSAETARAFARLLPPSLRQKLSRTSAAVIGPGAADALRHLPWSELRVALRPTQDGVLALL